MGASRKTCYKATDGLGQCLGKARYSVGEEYSLMNPAIIRLCRNGLHFCRTVTEVLEFYPRISDTRVFEVEPLGKVVEHRRGAHPWDPGKCATDRLKIVRELSRDEILGKLVKEASNLRFSAIFRHNAVVTWRMMKGVYASDRKPDMVVVKAEEVKE